MQMGKIVQLDLLTRSQVIHLRRSNMCVIDICNQLNLTKQSEINAVSNLCARNKQLRRYQFGIDIGAPVKRGVNAANTGKA